MNFKLLSRLSAVAINIPVPSMPLGLRFAVNRFRCHSIGHSGSHGIRGRLSSSADRAGVLYRPLKNICPGRRPLFE